MPTIEEKKRIKEERSFIHNWLLLEENRNTIVESHMPFNGLKNILFWAESPLKNVSCNFKIHFKVKKESAPLDKAFDILVKFKYTEGEEDFIDAMRSLKRQISLQHDINKSSIYSSVQDTVVKGTILTLDKNEIDDTVLNKQGIPVVRIELWEPKT